MLPAGLWEQVQVSLALTVASELAASFSGATDYTTLVKLVAAVSVLAEALDSVVSRDGSIYRDTADVFRGLTVLVFVRITMNALKRGQPAGARSVVQDFGLAAREGGGEIGVLSRMTLTAWPVIESFALSCIALLCITLVARLTGRAGGPSKVPREVRRLVEAITYAFADTASRMLSNRETQRVVAIVGVVLLRTVTRHAGAPGPDVYSSSAVLASGLGMSWFNTVVQLIVPDGVWSGSALFDITTALGMAILLRSIDGVVPGIASLQGYIEWHLSGEIQAICASVGVSRGEVCIVSGALFGVITLLGGESGVLGTLHRISALTVSNALVMWIIEHVRTGGPIDSINIVIVAVVLAKMAARIQAKP